MHPREEEEEEDASTGVYLLGKEHVVQGRGPPASQLLPGYPGITDGWGGLTLCVNKKDT